VSVLSHLKLQVDVCIVCSNRCEVNTVLIVDCISNQVPSSINNIIIFVSTTQQRHTCFQAFLDSRRAQGDCCTNKEGGTNQLVARSSTTSSQHWVTTPDLLLDCCDPAVAVGTDSSYQGNPVGRVKRKQNHRDPVPSKLPDKVKRYATTSTQERKDDCGPQGSTDIIHQKTLKYEWIFGCSCHPRDFFLPVPCTPLNSSLKYT